MSNQRFSRNVSVDESSITSIATAIKGKMVTSNSIKPLDFAKAVKNIGTTGTGTLNVSSVELMDCAQYASAKINDSNLTTNNIVANKTILGVDGTNSVINATGGNAAASDMANGKTAYVNNSKVTGTNRIYVSGTTAYIPAGWVTVV